VNVHLMPKLETLVQNKVKSGRYNSASEVVREALRLFEERDRLRELQIRELRKKPTRVGLPSDAVRAWTEKSSSRDSSGKNKNWGASANGHEALQSLARGRPRHSGNLGPTSPGIVSKPPASFACGFSTPASGSPRSQELDTGGRILRIRRSSSGRWPLTSSFTTPPESMLKLFASYAARATFQVCYRNRSRQCESA
jgi:antitoxin ParD1/3/4